MKKVLFFVIFFVSIISVFARGELFDAQQIKELFPSSTRLVYSLDGVWDNSVDGGQWKRVNVPGSVIEANKIVYQRQFKFDPQMMNRMVWSLYFLGVSNQAEVFVNEQFIGKYISNGIPFNVNIPQKVLTNSNNTIRIVISNDIDEFSNTLQNDIFAPMIITGIPRSIFLVGTPQLYISNMLFTSEFNSSMTQARVKIKAEITSKNLDNLTKIDVIDSVNKSISSKSFYIQFQIREKGSGTAIATSDMYPFSLESQRMINKEYSFSLYNFKPWSVDFPNLYEVVCKIFAGGSLVDESISNFSFRTLKSMKTKNGSAFIFNGQPFKFKGVYYTENFTRNSNYLSPDKYEADFKLLKILGVNTVIFKFNYPSPYLLSLCDRYGIMAFIDLPLNNTTEKQIASETVISNITNQSKNLITQYSSHPSVVAVGLGVGLADNTSFYTDFINNLSKIFKENSDKLLFRTVYSTNHLEDNKPFDFLIYQSYTSYKSFENLNEEYNALRELVNPMPIVISFGVGAQNYNHNGYSDPLSTEFQGYYIQNIYKISIVNNGYGAFYSDFNDYFSQNPILATKYIDEKIVSRGLIDLNHKTKLSFSVLKALFNDENEPLIDIGNFGQTVYTFIIVSLLVIILFFMLFSRYRRFQEYFVRATLRPFNFYSDIRDQRILSPMFTYALGIIIALSFGIFTESLFYYYKSSEVFQYLTNIFLPNQIALAIIYKIIWIPIAGIFVFALLYLIMVYLVALLIRIFAYFKHLNIHHFDVVNITIWGSVLIIFLLPFDIVMFKLLQLNSVMVYFIIFFSIIIFLMSIFRILKATAVLFDANFIKVYFVGAACFAVLFFGFYLLYQYQTNFLSSLSYFFNMLL